MAKVSEPWSSCQARHLAYISEYTTDIRHVEGINNPVADALSRVLISAVSTGVDYEEMARCQQQDASETLAYRTAVTGLRSGGKTYPSAMATSHCSEKNSIRFNYFPPVPVQFLAE